MNEQQRQACLEAMGITRYVRRAGQASTTEEIAEVACSVSQARTAGESPQTAGSRSVDVITADWETLRKEVEQCCACGLCKTRSRTVFGVGNPHAELMIIGEAPGAEEDRQGLPFVGRAGELLNNMLTAMGLKREEVYIANILKCRPPGNRNPSPEEAAACAAFLKQQVKLVAPRLILAAGGVAAHNLLATQESVGRLRGRLHQPPDFQTPVLVTYHPAYLLRRPEEKAKAWVDLQQLSKVLAE